MRREIKIEGYKRMKTLITLMTFCLFCLIGVNSLIAQVDKIEIIFFSGLNDSELKDVNQLSTTITRKTGKPVILQNWYDEKVRFQRGDGKQPPEGLDGWEKTEASKSIFISTSLIQENPDNLTVKNDEELRTISKEFDDVLLIETSAEWWVDEELGIESVLDLKTVENKSKSFKKIAKRIKKRITSSSSMAIVFANSPIPYLKSFESFNSHYEQELDKTMFKVQFGNNGCNDTKTLKPQGEIYVFSFEGVPYFEKYEVELWEMIQGVPELVRTEILAPELSESTYGWELRRASNEDWLKLIFDYPRLGEECALRAKERGQNEEIDPDCEYCRYDCLYGKRYGIRVRGYHTEFENLAVYNVLWSCLKNVLFQCEK